MNKEPFDMNDETEDLKARVETLEAELAKLRDEYLAGKKKAAVVAILQALIQIGRMFLQYHTAAPSLNNNLWVVIACLSDKDLSDSEEQLIKTELAKIVAIFNGIDGDASEKEKAIDEAAGKIDGILRSIPSIASGRSI